MVVLLLCRALTFFGLIWGCILSFKALKAGDDTQHMLRYWCVLSFLSIYDTWMEMFVSWLPFYSEAKFILLVWMLIPQSGGAEVLFNRGVRPTITFLHDQLVSNILPRLTQLYVRVAGRYHRSLVHWLLADAPQSEVDAWDAALESEGQALHEERSRRE